MPVLLRSAVSKQVSNASDRETQPSPCRGRKKYLRACLLSGVPGELKTHISLALSVLGGHGKAASTEQYLVCRHPAEFAPPEEFASFFFFLNLHWQM